MFKDDDFALVDREYFQILKLKKGVIQIKSRNTGHSWRIEPAQRGQVKIFHRHSDQQEFHRHGYEDNLEAALRMIQSHDAFQLAGRPGEEKVVLYCREGVVKGGRFHPY